MSWFNDLMHEYGPRSTNDWHAHNAYERGEITRDTLDESARIHRRIEEEANKLTVEDYKRKYK